MNKKFRVTAIAISFIIFFCFVSIPLSAKEITDMSGNKVTVPDKIRSVFSLSPAVTYMLYAIAPELVAGLNRGVPDSEKPYLRKSFQELPVLGGSFRNGLTLSWEMLLKVKPDVIIVWSGDGAYDKKVMDKMAGMNFPVAAVNIDNMNVYADTFLFLGKLLSREKRGKELSDYINRALSEVKAGVAKIPENKIISVYSAGMKDGLTTACESSTHAELIPMAGGINPVKCMSKAFTGMEKLNMERVLLLNPDAIITMEASFASNVYNDQLWQKIKAVKSKRVYLIPKAPLNWSSGGPSSFMGVLGLQWLAGRLYPEYFPKDMDKEAQSFIELFFGIDLSKEEIGRIISGK